MTLGYGDSRVQCEKKMQPIASAHAAQATSDRALEYQLVLVRQWTPEEGHSHAVNNRGRLYTAISLTLKFRRPEI